MSSAEQPPAASANVLASRDFNDSLLDMADQITDEERAKVRWYEVAALREREDRADDAYDKAVEALAKEFPKTVYGSIALVSLIAYISHVAAEWLFRLLGHTGVNVVTRILGILLAALAVQYIADGAKGLWL